MKISLIAGMAKNRTIGNKNQLPRHYSEDLQYFKKITNDHTIVMWLNTYYSVWKALPNRRNIVLSKQDVQIDWVEIFHSIENLLDNLKQTNIWEEVFVIWWASIYQQFLPLADKIYLTEIKKEYHGDTFFPIFEEKFEEISRINSDELDFVVYQRK